MFSLGVELHGEHHESNHGYAEFERRLCSLSQSNSGVCVWSSGTGINIH